MKREEQEAQPYGWLEVAARAIAPDFTKPWPVVTVETLGPTGQRVKDAADIAASMGARVEFCRVDGTITRGPNKGEPRWSKERFAVVVPRGAPAKHQADYEARTGLCGACVEGQRAVGWSVESGTRRAPCKACGGTGILGAVVAVFAKGEKP